MQDRNQFKFWNKLFVHVSTKKWYKKKMFWWLNITLSVACKCPHHVSPSAIHIVHTPFHQTVTCIIEQPLSLYNLELIFSTNGNHIWKSCQHPKGYFFITPHSCESQISQGLLWSIYSENSQPICQPVGPGRLAC